MASTARGVKWRERTRRNRVWSGGSARVIVGLCRYPSPMTEESIWLRAVLAAWRSRMLRSSLRSTSSTSSWRNTSHGPAGCRWTGSRARSERVLRVGVGEEPRCRDVQRRHGGHLSCCGPVPCCASPAVHAAGARRAHQAQNVVPDPIRRTAAVPWVRVQPLRSARTRAAGDRLGTVCRSTGWPAAGGSEGLAPGAGAGVPRGAGTAGAARPCGRDAAPRGYSSM